MRVDFFLDLVCADTKNAWPVIKEVIQTYGRDVRWRFHQFPLPYHTNAFLGECEREGAGRKREGGGREGRDKLSRAC